MKFWTWLRSNPYFVLASSALSAFAAKAAYNWVESGSPAITLAELKSTAIAAVGVVIVALYHLYMPTPAVATAKYKAQSKLHAWLLITLLLAGTMPVMATSGCTSNQLKADASTLASALTSLASAIKTLDPTVAADLTTAAATLTAALNGTGTGPAWEQVLNGAAAAAEAAMAMIPITAPFAALLAIAVSAAELIISATTSSTTVQARVMANPANLAWYLKTGNVLVKHRFGRSQSGDVKAAWNTAAIEHGYAAAVLK